jgi:thymidylate synthase (FAD)
MEGCLMDYIQAKLIGYTQPSGDTSEWFDDSSVKELIAYCARVSNPSNQMNMETSDKLLSYLIRNKHWSPFEMASMTIEITTTRDIARQLLRHRSFSFQEFSQRYSDPTQDLGFVTREARLQDTKNRQNSIETDDIYLQTKWDIMQQRVIDSAEEAYTWAVENGIAKEQARAVLPEGNTLSRLYVQGTIRSFIHYIDVRTDQSTQKEHRVLAEKIAEAVNKAFPFVLK